MASKRNASQEGARDDPAMRQALWKEANTIIIDSTYSGRAHQAMGAKWEKIDRALGLPAAVLSTFLAGGAGVTAIAGADTWVTVTLALVAASLSAARSFLRPDQNAEANGLKGDRFISLRNDARRFQQIDLRSALSLDALNDRSARLNERRNALRESPPRHIPRWAYEEAKRSIEAGESEYEDDPLWTEPE